MYMQGLGQTGTRIATGAVSAGGTIATAAAPSIAGAIGLPAFAFSWAVPVVGAAIAGVTLAITAWLNRAGPRQKVATTKIVDEAEPHLQANRDAYLAGSRTSADQIQALQNFDMIWGAVVEQCSQPQLGEPGQRCVNDRKPGGKWDWFAYYRDPIANDIPRDPGFAEQIGGLFQGQTGGAGLPLGPLVLGGAALLLAASL